MYVCMYVCLYSICILGTVNAEHRSSTCSTQCATASTSMPACIHSMTLKMMLQSGGGDGGDECHGAAADHWQDRSDSLNASACMCLQAPASVGSRCRCSAVSDVAAMNGMPHAFLRHCVAASNRCASIGMPQEFLRR